MALGSDGGDDPGRAKRRRVDEQGCFGSEEEEKGAPQEIPETRFSDLPIDVRYRILTLLPIIDAIRTSVVARGWRDLWKSRWHPTSCREIHLLRGDNPDQVLDELESRPRLRLDRFSLVIERQLRQGQFKRFLQYASGCNVEDLHVELRRRRCSRGWDLSFHFPLANPNLVHLSLRGIRISSMYLSSAATLFSALQVIHLYSVRICQWSFKKILSLCPALRTLDLRRCDLKEPGRKPFYDSWAMENLRSIVVVECEGEVGLDAAEMPSLLSLQYSGNYQASPFILPQDAPLSHLYICCSDPISLQFTLFPRYFDEGLPDDLSDLTVLTICSNALKDASNWLHNGAGRWTNLDSLHSLEELHLLMLNMDATNLADIYVFLKGSNCRNLERIFVQLPAIYDVPMANSSEEVLALAALQPPEKGSLSNLRTVKLRNFNWRRFEVQLVSFLLKTATSLEKLLVVSPTRPAMLNVPGVPIADLLVIKDALDDDRMTIISESDDDDAAIQPFHSSEALIDS